MSYSIDNSQDIIDIRDVQSRIDELESEREDLVNAAKDAAETLAEQDVTDAEGELVDWEDDNADELKTLQDLVSEVSEDASPMIRDSYFEEYAMQLADDLGAIDRNASWPLTCIDWDQAAEELQQDYNSVDYYGVTFWIRSC